MWLFDSAANAMVGCVGNGSSGWCWTFLQGKRFFDGQHFADSFAPIKLDETESNSKKKKEVLIKFLHLHVLDLLGKVCYIPAKAQQQ